MSRRSLLPHLGVFLVAVAFLPVACGEDSTRGTDGIMEPIPPDAPRHPPMYLDPVVPDLRLATPVPAVAVRVLDRDTGDRIERETEGWIEDGDYRAPLEFRIPPEAAEGELVLAGGFERPGSYAIRVEGRRYEPWTGSADVASTSHGWPATVTVDAALRFRSLSGAWDANPGAEEPGRRIIYHDRNGITMPGGGLPWTNGERLKFLSGGTFYEESFDLMLVPPDTLAGTVSAHDWFSGRSWQYFFRMVRTGPPPPR